MKPAEDIDKQIKKLRYKADAETHDRVFGNVMQALDENERQRAGAGAPDIWRIIMKSPVTKLAAVAVVIITVVFLIIFFEKAATPAYALEQTVEANHTIKTVHLRMFEGSQSIENNKFSDYWLRYNDAGKLSHFRCDEHDKDGVESTVWSEGIKKIWILDKNLVIVNKLNTMAEKWEEFAINYDPKLCLQRLYDLSKEKEEIKLEIDESAEDSKFIYVKATHSVHKLRLELVVDRETKLIKKLSDYHFGDQGYKLNMRIEFLSYNRIIDPSKFELIGIPDNAKVVDKLGDIIPGLRVGDFTLGMSKDEVLRKLGEPKAIMWGSERYTLNNLPREYFMVFDNVSFPFCDDLVVKIGVHSSLYKFTNGLGVGDSEQKIKQAFGNDFHLKEGKKNDFLLYRDKGIGFEIHKKNRTVIEISVFQITVDNG